MKNALYTVCYFICVLLSQNVVAQEVTFNGYPDLHFSAITSLDIDDNATNALSLDLRGRTIFWDLESQKPLRIWQHAGIGIKSKMIFDISMGASIFKVSSKTGLPKIDVVLYDLVEGKVRDTISFELDRKLIAYSMSQGEQGKQEVVFLLESKVIHIDLYSRRITWVKDIDFKALDINYGVNNQIFIQGDQQIYTVDANDQSIKTFIPSHIEGFDIQKVRGNYYISEQNGSLEIWDISDEFEINPIKIEGEQNLTPENRIRVLKSSGCKLVKIERQDKVSLYKKADYFGGKDWKKEFIKQNDTTSSMTSICFAKEVNYIGYLNDSRGIAFLNSETGEEKTVIKNSIPDTRVTYVSPYFDHMLYSDLGDGDDGDGKKNGQKSTYYMNMVSPSNPLKISDTEIVKAIPSDKEGFYVLDLNGFSFFDNEIASFEPYDLNNRLKYPLVGNVIDFDASPKYLMIKSEPTPKPEEIVFKNTEAKSLSQNGKQVGVKLNGIKLFGTISKIDNATSKIVLDKKTFILYNTNNEKLIDVIYAEDQDLTATIKGDFFCEFKNNQTRELLLYDATANVFVQPYTSSKLTHIVSEKSGNEILLRYHDKTCMIGGASLKNLKTFKIDAIPVMLTFSSKTKLVLYKAYGNEDKLFTYDYENSKSEVIEGVYCTKLQDLSTDGKYLALSTSKAIQFINVLNGEIFTDGVKEFEASPAYVKISSETGMALSARYSGRFKYWDLDRKRVHATFMLSPEGKYIAYNDFGEFDCHPDVMGEVYYSVRKEVVELEQLKDKFWNPGFWYLLPGKNPRTEIIRQKLNTIALYPDVQLETSMFQDELKVTLIPNQGGIGYVSFFINNVEIEENVNPDFETVIRIPLKDYEEYLIPERPNILGVVVYNSGESRRPLHEIISDDNHNAENTSNKKGWLKSRQKRIPVNYGQPKPAYSSGNAKGGWDDEVKKALEAMLDLDKTRLIGLVVGTSNYDGGIEIDLKYADNDANSMENALTKTGTLLFEDQNKVIVKKLISNSQDVTKISTRQNILNTMKELQDSVKVDDILIVFFSGHGLTYEDEYYYASKEATGAVLGENPKLSDINTSTISATEINDFLKNSKSLRKVLIFDACYSGSFAESLKKSGNSSQRKAMSKLKDKTGVYVLSSSLGSQQSVELPSLSQGVMTYSLLDGMSGKAAVDDVIEISNLIEHVIDHVPPLAQQKGYIQQPVFISPEASMSFAIGMPDESIAPAGSKVQIGRSLVFDTSSFLDYLLLGESLDEAIKTESENNANIPYMFSDFVTNNNVVIKGIYEQRDGQIFLKASFVRDNKLLKKVEVVKKTAKEIGDEIVKELTKHFNTIEN